MGEKGFYTLPVICFQGVTQLSFHHTDLWLGNGKRLAKTSQQRELLPNGLSSIEVPHECVSAKSQFKSSKLGRRYGVGMERESWGDGVMGGGEEKANECFPQTPGCGNEQFIAVM